MDRFEYEVTQELWWEEQDLKDQQEINSKLTEENKDGLYSISKKQQLPITPSR